MTGQCVMDNLPANDTAFANGNEIDFVDLSEIGTNSVATLDVTSEEIYCNQRLWGSGINSDNKSLSKYHHGHIERKRSETWSSGLSEGISKRKTLASQDVSKMQVPDRFTLKDKRRSSTPDNLNKTNSQSVYNQQQSNHSTAVDENRLIAFHRTLPEFSGLHNTSSSITNGSTDNKSIESVEDSDDLAGFMDINLGRSNCSVNEKVHNQHKQTEPKLKEVPSKKPAFGYIFDWMSPRSSNVSGKMTGHQPKRDLDTVSDKSSDTSLSSASTSSTKKVHSFKVLQKALSSNSYKDAFHFHSPFGPPSTTALILESRPRNLPSKSIDETKKHLAEYDKIITNVKKHELQDVKKRMKQLKGQQEYEERIANSSSVWSTQILPFWSSTFFTTRTRQLWWDGLPPSVRGKVWQLAIGNELNITKELYSIMVARSHDRLRHMNETQSYGDDIEQIEADRECTVDLIRLDISRTFPHLCIFQEGGPYHQLLHDVLGAYACYRPDVGYVQGMSFMAAMLLLNLDPAKAFVTFANLLNKPCQVAFFRLNEEMMKTYFATFEVFFEENLPAVFAHFKVNNLTPDMYLIDWIFTMFSKALDLDTASRVWDVFCRDGEGFLFRTAIAILKLNGELLLSMEFIQAAQYLIKLPSTFTHNQLFDVIATVTMVSRGNRRWKNVLSLMKDTT